MKTFNINITASHKSKRLYVDPYECKKQAEPPCQHVGRPNMETGEYVCEICHAIYDQVYVHERDLHKPEQEILIWNRNYDKARWVQNGLELLNGSKNEHFNDTLWYELLVELPNPFTWYEAYKVFHQYRITDMWTCLPSFIDLKPILNKKIVHHVYEYSDLGYTKYRISYLYLIYKFTQMFGSETEAAKIPLKGSKPWIKKTDEWWYTVCKDKGWKFIPTKMHSLKWDKENIVAQLKANLKIV